MDKLSKCIVQMQELKLKIDKLSKCYDKRRMFLIKQSEKQGNEFGGQHEFSYKDIVAKVSKSVKVEYNIKALKKKLTKTEFKRVTQTVRMVEDIDGLYEELMKYGVPKELVKKYIKTQHVIDEQKLNQEFDLGNISLEQISGCYEVKPSRTIVSIKSAKNEIINR